ncbi:MAG: GNAT family N-acetyltransferase [Caldilineaceae bacterium]|nr:GNAT family N-acetyltransferase [Caldilineaceae bacterium]
MIGVRLATPADWATLVALDQLIFGGYGAQEAPGIIRARLTVFPAGCVVVYDDAPTVQDRREALHAATKANEPHSPPVDTTILGYLTTEKWLSLREPALDEDPYLTHQPSGRVLNITTLAIAPTHQNRGLGALLIEQARQIAAREECTDIVLETAHAQAFYQRHGFHKIGERQERNIHLHIMHWRL